MTTIDAATQAHRYVVAACLLGTDQAGARQHIRGLQPADRHELASLVDWVIEYENNEED